MKRVAVVLASSIFVIGISAPPSEAWVAGLVVRQAVKSAVQRSAIRAAGAATATRLAARKMLEVAISPATLKMLATTAVIVGTEQAAEFVHNNMSQDTVTDAGTAYAATPGT